MGQAERNTKYKTEEQLNGAKMPKWKSKIKRSQTSQNNTSRGSQKTENQVYGYSTED